MITTGFKGIVYCKKILNPIFANHANRYTYRYSVFIYIYMHDMLASLLTLLMDTYKAFFGG